MRHFVLGLCVLTVAAPVTDAFAQNYLPTRDYSGPGTIVNMDVLQSGGGYNDYNARPPILSMPLPAPNEMPAPPPAPVMAAQKPVYQAPQPRKAVPLAPLPTATAVPAIASAPVPLLPPVPMPQAISNLPGSSAKQAPVQQAVSQPARPPVAPRQDLDPLVAAMEELPAAMPAPAARPTSGRGLDVEPVMAAAPVKAAPIVAETTPPSRHYTGGAPFADDLSKKLPEAVPLITEKTTAPTVPTSAYTPKAALAAVEIPSLSHQQPVKMPSASEDVVPPVAVAAKADRLLTPTVATVDGVFPAPVAGSKTAMKAPNAQPLITERANDKAPANLPVAAPAVQKPTADSVAWDMPAPVMAKPASRDLTVPPISGITTGTTDVIEAAPTAGAAVPRVPASELRHARMAAVPERQVLASINDDVSPVLPDPVMGRKAATYSELGVPGSVPAPSFEAPRNAVDKLVVPPMPLTGQELKSITGLSDATFPSETPIEAKGLRSVPDLKTAMLAAPTAPLSGAKPSQARDVKTEDDFEAYRIFFDASSDQLSSGEAAVLNKIVGKMQNDPSVRLRMQAYASGTPDTAGQARRLSLSRAMKIRSYMTDKGIPATRLDVRALGMGSAELSDTVKKSNAPADRVDMIFVRS